MGSQFGRVFVVTTFGESHGPAVGAVIDGCPSQVPLDEAVIQRDLDRRKPGGALASPRKEADQVEILSGVFEGQTLGTPIALLVRNQDARSKDYSKLKDVYRPSHADWTTELKYGHRDYRGGGRASARETVGRVAAGAVAKAVLRAKLSQAPTFMAFVSGVGPHQSDLDPAQVSPNDIDASAIRCPDPAIEPQMIEAIEAARAEGDSLGGVLTLVISDLPAGLGDPVFDKLEADLAKAIMSLPATKGVELGQGFEAARSRGSEHNDPFESHQGEIQPQSNRSGGTQGGISTGLPIVMRIAFKPPASIRQTQQSVTREGQPTQLSVTGRHDPFVAARAVPIVEAMAAIVCIDHVLRAKSQNASSWLSAKD